MPFVCVPVVILSPSAGGWAVRSVGRDRERERVPGVCDGFLLLSDRRTRVKKTKKKLSRNVVKIKSRWPHRRKCAFDFCVLAESKKELCDGVEGKWIKCVQIVDQGVRWVPPAFPFTSLSLSLLLRRPLKRRDPDCISDSRSSCLAINTHTRASWYLHLSQPSAAAAALAFIPRVFSSRNNNKQPKSSRTIMSLACRGKKKKSRNLSYYYY
jgi:hypothetical protein